MRRIPELDTLRGLLLVVMTFTHLPTRLSHYADQPLGFVSTAEAFIFLSAFLASGGYSALLAQGRGWEMRSRAWARSRKLYVWHLAILGAVFVLGSALASSFGAQPPLHNLLSVYFSDPRRALGAAVALVYQPPLLDILPMYIVFLASTPFVLETAAREGWRKPLALSALLWLFAQLDGRAMLFHGLQAATAWPFPLESLGAFDWFAWQAVWIAGLALGNRQEEAREWIHQRRTPLLMLSAALALVFFYWRHQYGGTWAGAWAAPLLDKWHVGALRVVNFAALGIVVGSIGLPLLRAPAFSGFTLLGRASLEVFCTHVLACVLCLSLVIDERTGQPPVHDFLMLAGSLFAMFAVAHWTIRRRKPRSSAASGEIRVSP